MRLQLNLSEPAGQRVRGAWARTKLTQEPREYPALDRSRKYRVTAQSVAMVGGYANSALSRLHANRTRGRRTPSPATLSCHPGVLFA